MSRSTPEVAGPRLGLRANWRQFWLLVAVNGFVGAMAGLERTVVPLLGEHEFGLASRSATLSFIASFGLVKGISNWYAGTLSDRIGRRRVLLIGWLAAIPVPFLVILAPTWSWVVIANLFLGLNQGLAWSATVIMKIDLVGPERRGLAMGLNEFAGYLAIGITAFATGVIAEQAGLRPEPFYLGIAFSAVGLALSVLFVRDTLSHMQWESAQRGGRAKPPVPSRRAVFREASWHNPALMSCGQAGLVNNLNDGAAWGLFPLFFAAGGLELRRIAILAAAYPMTWGVVQLATGVLSDRWGRKWLIVGGMVTQGLALAAIAIGQSFGLWLAGVVLLGVGTAMVYPTLLAAVGDAAPPSWRASAVGVYRFWRDSGYVVGALGAGIVSDLAGVPAAILAVAVLTFASGGLVAIRMPETRSRQ